MIESAELYKSYSHQPNLVGLASGRKESIELYVAHVLDGRSLRSLAREKGLNPSTVLRRIRKLEDRRDDPLIDKFFDAVQNTSCNLSKVGKDNESMTVDLKNRKDLAAEQKEEMRILRRLCETGAFLAIGENLAKGAVFRAKKGMKPTRIAVVNQEIAKSLALRDWIKLTKNEKVSVYHVTDVGRAAMRRDLAGSVEGAYGDQHREWGERSVKEHGASETQKLRVNLRESPLTTLARKKGSDGKYFISRELLDAGERLREDFELSQLGPRVAQNWDRFINGGDCGAFGDYSGGSSAAQERLNHALSALGSGLGDIALRCCCFLEGLEAAEKRMGWSARSGKIVLRIALQRLRLFYDEEANRGGDYIG